REIRYWITAKAPTQSPLLTASLPCLLQLLPGIDVLRSEFGGGVGVQAGGGGCNHTDGAAQDQTRGRYFTPRGATVVIAVRAEKLFQIIIGPGQIRHRIAGEESWPVTTGDLTEVPQRRCQRASRSLVSRHRAQESPDRER